MALLEFLAESSRRIKIFRPPVGPAARKCAGLFAQQSPCGFSVCFLASCFVPRLKRKSVHAVFLQKDRRALFSMNKYPPAKPGVFLRRAKPSGTSGTRHVALVRSVSCERLLLVTRKRA